MVACGCYKWHMGRPKKKGDRHKHPVALTIRMSQDQRTLIERGIEAMRDASPGPAKIGLGDFIIEGAVQLAKEWTSMPVAQPISAEEEQRLLASGTVIDESR